MGGYGSGRTPYTDRPTVEDSCVLDLARIRRQAGLSLAYGFEARGFFCWTRGGEEVFAAPWELVPPTTGAGPCVVLRYSLRRTVGGETTRPAAEDRFPLAISRPHYGGLRYWFVCACGRRCAKLYLNLGVWSRLAFRCRTCAGVAYASQREALHDRWQRRANKLRAKVRPRMRPETVERLLAEADYLERASFGWGLASILRRDPDVARLAAERGLR